MPGDPFSGNGVDIPGFGPDFHNSHQRQKSQQDAGAAINIVQESNRHSPKGNDRVAGGAGKIQPNLTFRQNQRFSLLNH
jgi:hypothetical protein